MSCSTADIAAVSQSTPRGRLRVQSEPPPCSSGVVDGLLHGLELLRQVLWGVVFDDTVDADGIVILEGLKDG